VPRRVGCGLRVVTELDAGLGESQVPVATQHDVTVLGLGHGDIPQRGEPRPADATAVVERGQVEVADHPVPTVAGPRSANGDELIPPSEQAQRPTRFERRGRGDVADRHDDIHTDWLSDGVKGPLPGDDRGSSKVVYEGTCLTVSAGPPQYLSATDLLASRVSRDEEDILLLYDLSDFTTVDDGCELLERYHPGRPIEAKVGFFLEELLASRG
jgi:hypothetical protein